MLISAEKSLQVSRQFWESFPERIREENVKPYTLPDPLKTFDGKEIRTKEEYLAFRREEVLQFYKDKLYGHIPPPPELFHWELTREKANASLPRVSRSMIVSFSSHRVRPIRT